MLYNTIVQPINTLTKLVFPASRIQLADDGLPDNENLKNFSLLKMKLLGKGQLAILITNRRFPVMTVPKSFGKTPLM